jgi:TolB protein
MLTATGSVLAQGDSPTLSSEEEIDIQKHAVGRIPILVEEFRRGAGATADDTQAVFEVLFNDLRLAGYFKLVRISPTDPADTLGASRSLYLVRGTVDLSQGDLVLRGVVESLPGRDRVLGRDYRTRPEWYREAAHRFADDIVWALTGYPGIARTKIAFVSNRGGNKEIYLVDYDGHGLRQVTRNGSINLSPAWSPDGKKLAYVSYQGGDADIFVLDLTSGADRLLVGGNGVQGAPAFSPDGKHVLFSQTRGRESEIYICREDGQGVRRLTRAGGINTSPCWSPDGRRIVFTSDRSGNPQLYAADAEGGSPRRITFQGKWNDIADWSPHGDRIAYCSRQNGGFRLSLVDASGLGRETVRTFGPGSDEHPSWAPNGRHVVFASSREGSRRLYVLDVEAGTNRRLLPTVGCSGAAWSPVPAR